MTPLETALLVIVSAILGALFMRWWEQKNYVTRNECIANREGCYLKEIKKDIQKITKEQEKAKERAREQAKAMRILITNLIPSAKQDTLLEKIDED